LGKELQFRFLYTKSWVQVLGTGGDKAMKILHPSLTEGYGRL